MGPDLGELGEAKPKEVVWHDKGAEGKLDLLVTLDFRMSTTCLYSDIVLPSATWYEKDDLNTSDMHPFIHPLSEAVQPLWESKSDWDIYKTIAKKFSELAATHLGTQKDLVLTPLLHDTPSELGQSHVGARLEEGRGRSGAGQDHAEHDGGDARLRRHLQEISLRWAR